MAEDLNNPLNNPGAEPVQHTPPPREVAPEAPDPELEDFLDEVFETRNEAPTESEPPEAPPPVQGRASEERPVADPTQQPSEAPSEEPSSHPAPVPDSGQEDLQRQVLQRLNEQLERMAQSPAEEPPQPEPITPEQLQQQYQPRIQQYVEAGWLDEDFVSLYPRQAALMVHMWDMGTQMQQGVQQTQQFTEQEQARRTREQAEQQIDTAINEVAARGEVFGALTDAEVRDGFKEFLVNEVNPRLSQVNADFLARQFYAYNHQLIFDLAKQQGGQGGQPEATPAQLAAQEGGGPRGAPSAPQQPEFMDLLEGTAAARWYQ